MASQRIDILPLAAYENGSRVFGPRSIPDNVVGLALEFRRCTTSDLTVWPNPLSYLRARMELSLDNGNTWLGAGGMGSRGGILVEPDLSEIGDSVLFVDLIPGTGRLLRGIIEILNGPILTSISVVVDSVPSNRLIRPSR